MWSTFISLFVLILVSNVSSQLEINTKQGKLVGRLWKSQKGRTFIGYTGIPYAKAPIGQLRFQPPVPAGPWKGILNATLPHSPCPQVNVYAPGKPIIIGNEDCLFLNVYKPEVGENLPVMFYIHGGSFNIGSGTSNWLGPEILLDRDVVLVLINYRLGALGFLSTEDAEVPGNNGLKDQASALRWVKENIASFGGSPNNITVFGNSAGGISAHYFTLSPLTKDLIAAVVLQSGAAVTTFKRNTLGAAKLTATQFGQLCNCATSSSNELIKCLKNIDLLDFMNKEKEFSAASGDSTITPFMPTLEMDHPGAFLSEDPVDAIKSKKFANIPILVGVVSQEGAYRPAEISSQGIWGKVDKDFAKISAFSFDITENVAETTTAIRKYYFGNKTIDSSTKKELSELFSDGWFVSSLDASLALLLKNRFAEQPIYLYLFGYRGSMSYTELLDPLFDYGVCHSDELLYLFRQRLYSSYKPTERDLKLTDVLTRMWTNFAKTGDPTPDTKIWKPLKDDKLQHLHIQDHDKLNMEEGLFEARRKFWQENVYTRFWKNI